MNDILPEATPYWQMVEDACRTLTGRYGYQEIRLPIVEQTALFSRTIGEVTDIVEKEMYTFEDRDGDSITLRPEGTAGCVRAIVQEQDLLYNQKALRLWYMGPMFRHERPQKGRYRQFHQFGAEAFGMAGPDVDVEQLLMIHRLWRKLGLSKHIELQINTLGTAACRQRYRDALVSYFAKHSDQLDEDSQRRLTTNPLRILDSKNPAMRVVIESAPKMLDYLDDASQQHFKGLCELLDAAEVPYVLNPTLVRGLDYYGLTVYEWVTDMLGAQGTICAGGRYDTLVEQIGGKPTPAVGFALGLERTVLLLQQVHQCRYQPHVCFVLMGDAAIKKGLVFAEQLRHALPWLRVVTNLSGGSFKSQFKRADKSEARWALIIGDDELVTNKVSIKDLREDHQQQQLTFDELKHFLETTITEAITT